MTHWCGVQNNQLIHDSNYNLSQNLFHNTQPNMLFLYSFQLSQEQTTNIGQLKQLDH